jgi:glycerol uptake facilitator-like aquaporin
MPNESIARGLLAEALGSTVLAATVVGSGVMGERLSGGNTGIALLSPISGAHFNPAVSVVEAERGRLAWRDAGL